MVEPALQWTAVWLSRTKARQKLRMLNARGAARGDIFARYLAAHQRIWN